MTRTGTRFLRVSIAIILVGAVSIGLWATYWAVCLHAFGYRCTETVLTHRSASGGTGEQDLRVVTRVRFEDSFGARWEREVYGLDPLPSGTKLIWYEARPLDVIVGTLPAARGEFWSVWGLPTVSIGLVAGLCFVLFFLRDPIPRPMASVMMLAVIALVGFIAIPSTLRCARDVQRVMSLNGYKRWTPEAALAASRAFDLRQNSPNHPPLQTPTSGTPAADAPVAPPPGAAGR